MGWFSRFFLQAQRFLVTGWDVRGISVAGARAVVTGAGSGIGRATALRFARQGAADVICVDIDQDAAENTAAACREQGCDAAAFRCDVADAAAQQALADQVEVERGAVDILVNNAGVGAGGPFLEQSVEDWNWLIGINLNGVSYGCRAFGSAMVKRGRGHVVNVASGAAYMMSRSAAAYCTSKAGVVAFSRCLRSDWAEHGVGVSVICPGVINTPLYKTNTRMYGRTEAQLQKTARIFEKFGHSPDLVAKAIVTAIRRNQEQVPVGIESAVLYRVLPFLPRPVEGLVTRHMEL